MQNEGKQIRRSHFFEKYNQMSRSIKGLAGAGEWPTLETFSLPDFAGKNVLDLGCGLGWHAAYAIEHGAAHVTGIDISEKMLEKARQINGREGIEYRREAFEDSEFPENSFDVVICSLMLHYLASYDEFLEKIHRWLKPDGVLAYTVEHPIFTAEGSQDWYYGQNGEILHFPVDHYFQEGKREAVFLGRKGGKVSPHPRSLSGNAYEEGLPASPCGGACANGRDGAGNSRHGGRTAAAHDADRDGAEGLTLHH